MRSFGLTNFTKHRSTFLIIQILSRRDRVLLLAVALITFILALLDLVGIFLIGVVGSLSATGLSGNATGNRVNLILEVLRIQTFDYESQVIFLGLTASIFLISKTLFSLFLIKKTLFFMARRAATISAELLAKFFSTTVSKVNQQSAQKTIYALTDGVTTIMVGVIGIAVALISDLVLLLTMIIGLFLVDPIAALISVFMFTLLALFLYLAMRESMQKLGEQHSMLQIESKQKIQEAIYSYRELLVRDRRGFYIKRIADLRLKQADGIARFNYVANLSKYSMEITMVISVVLLAFQQFSTRTALSAIATITLFLAASTRIMPAVVRVQQGLLTMKNASSEAKPTLALVAEYSDVVIKNFEERGLIRDHLNFTPEVIATDVSFSYGLQMTLTEVNFQAKKGEFVAIVGSSGSGKSTLVDILLGALQANSGMVKIADMSPTLAFSKWPGAVSYVPQDSTVIEGTIRENLGIGFPMQEIQDEHCWQSLRLARLDQFILSLPKQLETYVGERGTRLSGGQRQRLGIARALISNPKLLILDEATSSLDGATESEISDALRSLKGELTLVVVAHRLSTVIHADRIYFMEAGYVKGFGTFEELKVKYPEFLTQAELMGL